MHAMLREQKHRRFLKSHMSADCVPWYEGAKYIFIARDGRDAFMSWHNHIHRIRGLELINAAAAREELPILSGRDGNIHEFFKEWISNGDNFLNIVASYWARRERENLLIVHYNDLKADLSCEMSRIAEFLEIRVPQALWTTVVDRCTFDGMRSRSSEIGELKASLAGGIKGLIFKGTNGRWREVLTREDLALYQVSIMRVLSAEAVIWLEAGRSPMA
jgi:aryl sulfotransferase